GLLRPRPLSETRASGAPAAAPAPSRPLSETRASELLRPRPLLRGRSPKLAAGPARRPHAVGGHSQAAPRTPLESPCRGGTIGVVTTSEKTYCASLGGTCV